MVWSKKRTKVRINFIASSSEITVLQYSLNDSEIIDYRTQFKLQIKCNKNCNPDNFNYRMKYKSDLNAI